MRTQVGIVGAGPAGLLLSQLLDLHGIETVIVERQSQAHVEGRIRAGLLEPGTVALLEEAGVADRLHREGLVHGGIEIAIEGDRHRIDFVDLTDGNTVTVYGQTEITKDLFAARHRAGADIVSEAGDVAVADIAGPEPKIQYRKDGETHTIECDVIAGCDGFHGICRASIGPEQLTVREQLYPFAWLGILAETPPVSPELIYAHHSRGFALFTMRSTSVSRLYLQCTPDENLDDWPDDRIWEELQLRLGGDAAARLVTGPALDKSVIAMRSFVAEPMQHGRLFLAGDAAHIVPPTGAKGLNLAASDVRLLSRALIDHFEHGRSEGLEGYSAACLRRVWNAQRFSWWMTALLHRFPEAGPFDLRRQRAELDYLVSSRSAMTALAENYVGLPFG